MTVLVALPSEFPPLPANPRLAVLTGRSFGRLSIVGYAGKESYKHHSWWWRCQCGAVGRSLALNLKAGRTTSCGCLMREVVGEMFSTHGHTRRGNDHPLYGTWKAMKQRCADPKCKSYPDYGARGISVCARWTEGEGGETGFECFLADMGPKPTPAHSIDRKDNDGDYRPDNCRWATKSEQMRNRRRSRRRA